MKPTDTNIAKFFDTTRATLRNYKKGSKGKQHLYNAMKEYFESFHSEMIKADNNISKKLK